MDTHPDLGGSAPSPTVLIVDDNRGLTDLWSFALSDAGYHALLAHSGHEALALRPDAPINVAVLDLQLPDMTGLEVFLALRERTPDMEGIIITGHASTGSAVEALHRGIHSYLIKPVELPMLCAQVERALERQRLLREREQHLRDLEHAYAREARIAETLQRCLLGDVPTSLPGLTLAHRYQPALEEAEVGGDFYDVVPLGNGLVGLMIGDVSGKGLEAARFTALAKDVAYGYAVEDPDPGKVLSRLNHVLTHRTAYEVFVTLFLGVLDIRHGRLLYSNAGHEPALLHRPASGATDWLEAVGPPAGAVPGSKYRTHETSLDPEDVLMLYTDGASGARRDDTWLGVDGLVKILAQHIQPDLDRALQSIYARILEFGGEHRHDDIAILLVRR